jgi:hypothetical protein
MALVTSSYSLCCCRARSWGGESMEESMYPGPNGAGVVSDVTRGRSVASWPAIIAGTFVAISVSLILLALGSGLGVTSLLASPDGISAKAIVVMAAIWLIVTQWISAALGGFITGRLRARWHGTHTHEVFFRDTAHGLVTWAMATVALAVLAGTSLHSMIAGGLNAASGISSPAASMAPYGTDKLFRSTTSERQNLGDARLEADHILKNAVGTGSLPDADRAYLAELIATNTGISASEAQVRINDWLAKSMESEAKVKAEAAAAREAAIFTALSLLIGAFIASVSAVLGGRLRDEHP